MTDRGGNDELDWSTVLDSKDAAYLKQFLTSGINLFLEKLAVSSLIASGEVPQNNGNIYENFHQITSDIVKPIISMCGSEVSVPVNAGITLIAYAAYRVKKKINKDKAKRTVDVFTSDDNVSSLIFAMTICDICRMLEHQIILLGKTGPARNIKFLAEAIVKRSLNYVTDTGYLDCIKLHRNSSTFTNDMAKHLIFGVFRGKSKKSSKSLDFKVKNVKIKFTCGDIIDQLGITIGDMQNSATAYYFDDQFDRYIKYLGHRRSSVLLDPEHMSDNNCSYLPLKAYRLSECHNLASSYFKHMDYKSKITTLKNIEQLQQYALQVLRCVLCEDHCYYIEESLKSLRAVAANLATKDDLHKEIDIVIDQIKQLDNKDELSQLIRIMQSEFLSNRELFRGANENFKRLESIISSISIRLTALSYLAMENRKAMQNMIEFPTNKLEKPMKGT